MHGRISSGLLHVDKVKFQDFRL